MIASVFQKFLGDMLLLVMVLVWASTFLLMKNHVDTIDPVAMVFWRFLMALVFSLGWFIARRKPWSVLMVYPARALLVGFILWCMYVPQTIGIKYTTATNAGFIMSLYVPFVPVLSVLLFQMWPGRWRLMAALISMAGLHVLTGGMSQINHGDLILMISAMACAFYVLFSHRYLHDKSDPLGFCIQQFFVVTILTGVWVLCAGTPLSVPREITSWVALVYLGLPATALTWVVYAVVQQHVSAMRVTLIFSLEPLFAAGITWAFANERLSGLQWFGGCLMVFAVILSEAATFARVKKQHEALATH